MNYPPLMYCSIEVLGNIRFYPVNHRYWVKVNSVRSIKSLDPMVIM
jgi:hypothetical protein